MKRRFAIPVLTLGAGATACTEPIEGSWSITQAAGETMPYIYEYGGTTYTLQSSLNVTGERVSLSSTYSTLYDDDTSTSGSTSLSGTLSAGSSRRSYTITFPVGDEEWSWDCGMPGKDELSCTDSDGESWKAERWPILLEGI